MSVEISIRDLPEILAELRAELAGIVRLAADDEPIETVRRRLREIAALFECGQVDAIDWEEDA